MRRLVAEILLLWAVKLEELAVIIGDEEIAKDYLKFHKIPDE